MKRGTSKRKEEAHASLILLGLSKPNLNDEDRVSCLIYPMDPCKQMFWDVIMSLMLLITCTMTPFTLAFSDELDKIKWYGIMNYTIDSFFLVDIFVNFNTAVYE